MGEEHRHLSDDDVSALADEMEKRMVNRFYNNLGQGVWAVLWKAMVIAAMTVAAYGAAKGFK